MKHLLLHRIVPSILLFCTLLTNALSEGSKDFIDYPGERLFFHAQVPQQLKVYVAEGEFLNFGASHVGITGGFITVFRPDGSVHSVYNNTGATEGLAIINNNIEERAGPTGGGTLNGNGYKPGVILAGAGEDGIWTFTLEFPRYNIQTFINLENDAPWNRDQHQPLIQRVITAWDITVSQNAAANNGGKMLEGRVYSNEYGAIVNLVTATTSPRFFVLSKDGIQYEIIFGEVNPWGFQINSSSKGVMNGLLEPYYKSAYEDDIIRVSSLDGLDPDQLYIYEPQAEDNGEFINNKVFFNKPNRDLPTQATVTDIFRNNTHVTWLLNAVDSEPVGFDFIRFSPVQRGGSFLPDGVMDVDLGSYIIFDLSRQVSAQVLLDLNYDGDYDDEEDRALYKTIGPGVDTIFWNARNGIGETIEERPEPINIDFKFIAGQGEVHIALADIEENPGGIIFRRLNGLDAPAEGVIYNHIPVGGGYSGGILPYQLDYTDIPYTYSDFFGNRKYLDYYSFEGLPFLDLTVELTLVKKGYDLEDTDYDGIADSKDIDDDNDGIPDHREYCFGGGATCLPAGLEPWGDNDGDGVKNYLDNDDPSINLPCIEIEDGVCESVRSIYDYDGDGRPNHLDSDSDNDGILDVVEAGHGALDADRDGIIDGPAADFGANGFYNALSTDPIAIDADSNYDLLDTDGDEVYNFLDLDSDNDGIPEVIENQLYLADADIDGRLDVGNLYNSLEELFRGIPIAVHPSISSDIADAQPDQDGDSIPNHLDLDSDNDGIHDVAEGNYPDDDDDGIYGAGLPEVNKDGVPSVEDKVLLSPSGMDSPFFFGQYDFDKDLVPDFLDLDSDNDGMHDVREANFSDPDNNGFLGTGVGTTNGSGITIADAILVPFRVTSKPGDWDGDNFPDYKDLDTDNDGIHDVAENGITDANGDGFAGGSVAVTSLGQIKGSETQVLVTSIYIDQDGDGVPDFRDRDSDNDGIHDVAEARLSDPDNNGIINTGNPILDDFGKSVLATSFPGDQDSDGIWNYRDLDADNDGLLDAFESGGADDDIDGIIGSGSITIDRFGIPITDALSAVSATSDPIDTNGDGLPDYLSLDSDGDKIPDVIEAKLLDPDFDGLLGDGTPLVDSNGLSGDPNATPPLLVASSAVDTDLDGLEDFRDLDSDGDNLLDIDECPTLGCRDLDQDGLEDFRDVDRDGDGLADGFECPDGKNCLDLDGDGLPNIDDLDSDGDDLADSVECPGGTDCPDNDNTSVIDVYEFTCHRGIAPNLVRATENASYCKGTEILLSAENDGLESGPITYTWTLPNGSTIENMVDASSPFTYSIPSANDTDDGTYTLVSKAENGCSSVSVAIDVQVIDVPSAASLTATTKSICTGGVIEIDADIVAMNGLTYDWFFDNGSTSTLIKSTTSPTLIITDAVAENTGSYSMIVKGPNCESPISNLEFITVKPVLSTASATNPSSPDRPICGGGSLSLFADAVVGANYRWTGPNGFTSTDQNPVIENITMSQNGDYSYTIEVPGCQILESSTTTVYIQEMGSKPAITGASTACIGGSTTLSIPNDYEVGSGVVVLYEWYAVPGGNLIATTDVPTYTINNVSENTPKTYYAEVILGECTTEPSDLFDIEILEVPSEVAYIPEDAFIVCDETEIAVTASEPVDATGRWTTSSDVLIVTPDQSSTLVTNLGSQPFTLIWTLSKGSCENFSSDTLYVDFPTSIEVRDDLLLADRNGIIEDYDVLANDNLPSGAMYNVRISSPPSNGTATITTDGRLTYAPNTGFLGTDEIVYEVCLDACSQQCDVASLLITVEPSDCKIPNIMTPNGDGLNDTFIVPCVNQHPDNEIMIFNRWGDKVFGTKQYENNWDGRFRGNELPPGTYYYLYKSDPTNTTEQLGYITLVR